MEINVTLHLGRMVKMRSKTTITNRISQSSVLPLLSVSSVGDIPPGTCTHFAYSDIFPDTVSLSKSQLFDLSMSRYHPSKIYPHELLLDLAAESRQSVPADLPDYIRTHDIVRAALRVAKEVDATDEEWTAFMEMLKSRQS